MFSCTSCEKSEAELEHIALHDPNPMRQRDAVCGRMSEETLTHIYYASKNSHVRAACVSYIDSIETLRKIALNKSQSDVARCIAISKLKDVNLARQIMADPTDNAKEEAIKLLSPDEDENIIRSVAFNKNETSVIRSEAILRMKDQLAIKRFLETETDIQIRLAAASALTDSKLNEEMFYKERNIEVRLNLIEVQKNEKILKALILKEDDEDIRAFGIKNITDQEYLKIIAKSDRHIRVRQESIKNIKDKKFIEKQAFLDVSPSVRAVAVDLISDKNILEKISNEDVDRNVKIAASRRLRKL
jgi:hypothetical protein